MGEQVRVGVNVTVAFCTLHTLSTLQVRDSATAIPMPDLSTPSSSSPQPGLCGPSDKEYYTSSDVEDVEVVVLSGSRPSSAPGNSPGVKKPTAGLKMSPPSVRATRDLVQYCRAAPKMRRPGL